MTGWPFSEARGGIGLRDAPRLAGIARRAVAADRDRLRVGSACRLARVRAVARRFDGAAAQHVAMLVPADDGFRAVVNRGLWSDAHRSTAARRRLRFVLAHELGHTLFYEPGRPPWRPEPADRREETFCHRFAISLLVPTAPAGAASVDPNGLRALAARYDVSLRVAARAVALQHPGMSVVMLRWAPHPRRGDRMAMRTVWGASDRYIAAGESLKSALAQLAPGEHGRAIELLTLSGRTREVDVEAWRFSDSMLAVVRERPGHG